MKIIRDKLAEEIIAEEGPERIKKVGDDFAGQFLLNKLLEEAEEVDDAMTKVDRIEEIGDLLEVLDEVMVRYGITPEEVQKAREAKAEKRGLFKKNYILTEIKK